MSDKPQETVSEHAQPIPFKAETRQLLDILIHSLYTDREIFLRELISNAADALTRVDFEILTNRQILDPEAELAIRLIPDAEKKTLTIKDNGIGMTAEELTENLGTIAHTGAKAFLEAAREAGQGQEVKLADIIGQFGVGFYSAFMVADQIRVVSRSFEPEAQAAAWQSSGEDTFTVEPAEKPDRGTDVIIQLKEDAEEFLQEHRLNHVVRKHSYFISFPIYVGEKEEQVNRQTALWRQQPAQTEDEAYQEYYKQQTLDGEPPLTHAHMAVDAPVQMYALLFIPASPERNIFSPRKEDGLKLYSHKVLIQEYCKDLLPEYFGFVEGVVDSEDLPLNVSRESVQSNRIMANLRKLVTSKVLSMLEELASKEPEKYERFWKAYQRHIKQGIAIEQTGPEKLYPLLRFHTTTQPESWSSLDEYLARMQSNQKVIYYLLGDDERAAQHSPHLDALRKHNYEVLLLTDPLDALMLVRLTEYKEHPLTNVASSDLDLPEIQEEVEGETKPELPQEALDALIDRFKAQLGDRVTEVRITNRLTDSPARLVDPQGGLNQQMQRVYRMLDKDYEVPKKVLELNPEHPLVTRLNSLSTEHELSALVIEQIYEDALLIEGLHPNPAGMIDRIQQLMQAALD